MHFFNTALLHVYANICEVISTWKDAKKRRSHAPYLINITLQPRYTLFELYSFFVCELLQKERPQITTS